MWFKAKKTYLNRVGKRNQNVTSVCGTKIELPIA